MVELDRFPRVLLVDGLGLVTVGSSVKDCNIAADIYEHTVPVICAAASLGGFSPVSEADLFDCEYWELEQRKLKLGKKSPGPLDGKICYVTGGASGMGLATARLFAEQGCNVFIVDFREDRIDRVLNCAKGSLRQFTDIAASDSIFKQFLRFASRASSSC